MKKSRTIEFFAGSGLVTTGLAEHSSVVWANDISEKKAHIYTRNHGAHGFSLEDISLIKGGDLPAADISWASFPCQDLSLAGKMEGLEGKRSGMFWQWLRILDEMLDKPRVLCLENVVGLISVQGGAHYRELHTELEKRGYRVGPMLLDAAHWLPQSRKRVFVVAVKEELDTEFYEDSAPNWTQPTAIRKACLGLSHVVWWSLPKPNVSVRGLDEIIQWDEPVFTGAKHDRLISLISVAHRERMKQITSQCDKAVFPGYRRTRNGQQVLELRFDNIAGCLRTAEGGSSKQFVVLWDNGELTVRLLTVREAARLMGAEDSYLLGNSYNDSYSAMGDAVAVPVVAHIAKYLLSGLACAENSSKIIENELVLNG